MARKFSELTSDFTLERRERIEAAKAALRQVIQAMGGDLEIRAVFPDRAVTITNFSSLAQDEGSPQKSGSG